MSEEILSYKTGQELQAAKQSYHLKKLAKFREGVGYDLSVINPEFPVDKLITDRLLEFCLQDTANRYTVASGLPEFAEALTAKYQRNYNCQLDSKKNIVQTRGCGQALNDIFRFLGKPESRILLPRPVYAIHLEAARSSKLDYDFYDLGEGLLDSVRRVYDPEIHQFLLLNFPNNPTGRLIGKDLLSELLQVIDPKRTIVVNDYVYADLLLKDQSAVSLCNFIDQPNILEYYSLSKSYSIPGWRIGALLGSENLINKLKLKKSEADYGSFIPFQRAAAVALSYDKPFLDARSLYQSNYEFAYQQLSGLGCLIPEQYVASFIWFELPEQAGVAWDFTEKLLEEVAVALQPGDVCGLKNTRFLRMSMMLSRARLEGALIRLSNFMSAC